MKKGDEKSLCRQRSRRRAQAANVAINSENLSFGGRRSGVRKRRDRRFAENVENEFQSAGNGGRDSIAFLINFSTALRSSPTSGRRGGRTGSVPSPTMASASLMF